MILAFNRETLPPAAVTDDTAVVGTFQRNASTIPCDALAMLERSIRHRDNPLGHLYVRSHPSAGIFPQTLAHLHR